MKTERRLQLTGNYVCDNEMEGCIERWINSVFSSNKKVDGSMALHNLLLFPPYYEQ